MQLSLKRLIGMIFILAFGITFFVMMFPQTNTVSIHEIRNNDFPREYIAESYRHYLELEIDQYDELKYVESQKTVVIFPTFTGIAYRDNGFYSYYAGQCDESCITLQIPEKSSFRQVGLNAFFLLTYLGYPSITDIELDQNPQILQDYNKVILLHNEYVTKNEFDSITNHSKVIYLYPNALYAEVEYDKIANSFTLIRGHGYPEGIDNGFDWEFDNTHPFEYDRSCKDWKFYEIPNGIMLNCFPEQILFNNLDILKKIKEF